MDATIYDILPDVQPKCFVKSQYQRKSVQIIVISVLCLMIEILKYNGSKMYASMQISLFCDFYDQANAI